MRVGWLGLGAMGAPMARRVAGRGHDVVGFDVAPDRATGAGVMPAGSPAGAVRGADAVVVMVATPEQAETVLFGPEGAVAAMDAGPVVLVMATVGPSAVSGWADRLAPHGLALVDAPVSGGVARAGTGDLLVMVSGAPEAVARVQPLLDAMARSAPVVGERPGDGQRVKLVNQLLCGVHIAAAAEALAFAERLGLDAAACWAVLREGAAASFMFEDRGARMVAGAFDDVRSALDIFVKDMGLVVGTAASQDFEVPLAATAERLYQAGSAAGLGRRDDSVLIEVARGVGR